DNGQKSDIKPSDNVVGFGGDWRELEQALESARGADVLLHYAGRGYQRFGCPIGLPAALGRWKAKSGGSRLVVFFHELPAPLSVTNRHYWINLCSRMIAARVAKLADVLVTNSQDHVKALKRMVNRKGVHLFPVASMIPPPAELY